MAAIQFGQYPGIQPYYPNQVRPAAPAADDAQVRKVAEQTQQPQPQELDRKPEAQAIERIDVHEIAPQDVSLSFVKNSEYATIGTQSDLKSLDMQKAISDMQRDSVLQDYQYFVGSSDDLLKFEDEDGKVFLK